MRQPLLIIIIIRRVIIIAGVDSGQVSRGDPIDAAFIGIIVADQAKLIACVSARQCHQLSIEPFSMLN